MGTVSFRAESASHAACPGPVLEFRGQHPMLVPVPVCLGCKDSTRVSCGAQGRLKEAPPAVT